MWVNIKSGQRPNDETNVLVKNANVCQVPVMAYYNQDQDCFLPLTQLNCIPLLITHYMEIPD